MKYLSYLTCEGSKAEDKMFEDLKENEIVKQFALKLRIDTKVIIGLIAQLMKLHGRSNT